MRKIIKLILIDIVRNKIVLFYTLLLSLLTWTVFLLEDNPTKGILTTLHLLLLIVPLFAILFSTIYIYNSYEFIELLLSQPIQRKTVWTSLFTSLVISMSSSFLMSVGLPVLVFNELQSSFILLLTGIFITLIFISIAFLTSILNRDRAKGIGVSIIVWLFFSLLYDGIVLYLLFQFAEYPIEKYMVLLAALNPIDLSRILNLLQFESAAMLGYTGAIFKNYFGTGVGTIITILILFIWSLVPFLFSFSIFDKKDL